MFFPDFLAHFLARFFVACFAHSVSLWFLKRRNMERERLSKKELVISTAFWVAICGAVIAAFNCDREKEDYRDNPYPYQPKNEKIIPPPRHVWAVLGEEFNHSSVKEKETLETALEKMKLYPEYFNEQDGQDMNIYFSIYQKAGEKYHIPWHLLWIIHKAESTVSRDPSAFEEGNLHYGAMQRAVNFYSKEDVRKATQGLEDLASLPQRHPDDWEEIAWAAFKMRNDMEYATQEGSNNPLFSALLSYSADEPAYYRYDLLLRYQSIFQSS